MTAATHRAELLGERVLDNSQSFDLVAFARDYGGITTSVLKSGAIVFRQGEPADGLFYIEEGRIQLSVVSTEGKEGIIAVLDAGNFFGQGCLIGEPSRRTTAICIAESIVARLDQASFIRAIRQDTQFAEFYMAYTLKRSARMKAQLQSQLFDSSEQRLARILLLLANYGGKTARESVIDNLDQEALAQMVGTTRARINHFMNKFRRLGYIDYNGRIIVHSALLKTVLQEAPEAEVEQPAAAMPDTRPSS